MHFVRLDMALLCRRLLRNLRKCGCGTAAKAKNGKKSTRQKPGTVSRAVPMVPMVGLEHVKMTFAGFCVSPPGYN